MLTGQITCAQKSVYTVKNKETKNKTKIILQVSYLLAYSSAFKVV